MENIRNFVITAHIDHGKSTLADRLLELTGTVEERQMRPQYLDQLDLERERGITIKMAPVRMLWHPHRGITQTGALNVADEVEYILNLIDTPGHSDFSYEVSRALAAVEGAVLLVDATQGVQAQTLANFESAKKANLKIIGAVNKIDAGSPEQITQTTREISELLGAAESEVFKISGKTGEGVTKLLQGIIARIPPPPDAPESTSKSLSRALIFDSLYDEHKGIIAFVRVFDGSFALNGDCLLFAAKTEFRIKEIGYFSPELKAKTELSAGEIGYIATGIKDPDKLKIGDTILSNFSARGGSAFGGQFPISNFQNSALPGYEEPKPVVFVSFYPEDGNEYNNLKQALSQLKLNDSALRFESDFSEVLGRGFKGGFLGRLHFEITAERILREFKIATVHSFPSVAYQIKMKGDGWKQITNPKDFPDETEEVLEPMTKLEILTPPRFLESILDLKELFRFKEIEVKASGIKALISAKLPLADLISDLDDKIKSASEGFASLSYELIGWERAEVSKLEILLAHGLLPGLTRIIPKRFLESEGRSTVLKLKELLPRLQFTQAIQAQARGRIIARETIPAMRKDVTGYLYGGDRTRKMKLWKKQQRGKERLKERAETTQVKIPAHIFKELLKR